jgi:ribosomal protein S18 acetylase RimI-like enzyme
MDKDKAIRSAKLTAAGLLDKARARTAVTRAGGQIAPSKYLPNVPRQVHADGGRVTFGKFATHKHGDTTIGYKIGDDGVAEVHSVKTPQAKRGQGSARAAMNDFLSALDEAGVKHTRLISAPLDSKTSSSKLVGFYKSLGFDTTGERANQAGDPWMARQVHAGGGKVDFVKDNPGGDWLANKQSYAFEYPRMKGIDGAITGWMGGKSDLFLPTHILKSIEPLNNEKRVAGEPRFDDLMSSVSKEGFDPHQKGNKVVVAVNHRGQPFVLEGNTRVSVAHAMGVPSVKAEVRYWNGAEEADGPMHPDKVSAMASDSPDITKSGGGSVTDSDEFRNWFGNSVTHTDGDPHVFYTGTSKDKDFTSFNVGRHGAWFTRDPAEASEYAEQNDSQGYKQDGWKLTPINTASRVIPAYVKAENPYTGDLPDEVLRSNYKAAQSDWFDTLRRKGHDAWVPARYNGDLVVALKEPQQIKSIFNNGKFDPNQKHMNKAGGGEVDGDEDGITAYHGSPHSFDQFDIGKLGTGEGNQSYGHGLYFAGNENIAKHYRDTLTSGLNSYTVDDVPASKLHGSLDPANSLKMNYAQQIREGKSHENAINFLKAQYNGKMTSRFAYPEDIPYHKAQLDRLEEMRVNPPKVQHLSGHMYKVKINAGPHELLDWDKPLSEQHPAVKAAIKATGINVAPTKWENNADLGDGLRLIVTPHPDLPDEEEFTKYRMQLPNGRSVPMSRNDVTRMLGDQSDPEGIRGSEIYRRLTQAGNKEHTSTGNLAGRGDQWASEKLRSVGIKGLRYLDAGSRAKDIDGDPTHNYVMFHHDPVQVVDKYEYGGAIPKARDVSAALALTRRFTKDGKAATVALKPKGK